jgi:hypothetical protein
MLSNIITDYYIASLYEEILLNFMGLPGGTGACLPVQET